ncbi:hypothetical protein HDV02_000634 [Globomyces sp. JEL0801]|nr:hypothetical protein HDV02_000634 [Globomyces sp. JEL0801]
MQLKVSTCGSNAKGQLGIQSFEDISIPTLITIKHEPISTNNNYTACAGGSNHTILAINGQLYVCGDNSKGQLGIETDHTTIFIPSDLKIPVKFIACGWDSSFVVTNEGDVYGCGDNTFGTVGIRKQKLAIWENLLIPNVVKISCGMRHTLFLLEDGSVLGCGSSRKGTLLCDVKEIHWIPFQLQFRQRVLDIACGQFHSVVLMESHQVYVFGRNQYGQLGISPDEISFSINPIRIDLHENYIPYSIESSWSTIGIVCKEGEVVIWGRCDRFQTGIPADMNKKFQLTPQVIPHLKVKKLVFGSEHAIALSSDGTAVTWGWNEHGNCGLGHLIDVSTFTKLQIQLPEVTDIGSGAGHSIMIHKEV